MTRDSLRTLVCETLLEVLEAESVDANRTFGDQGLDSMAAVEFRGKLRNALDAELPLTAVFEHDTADKLALYLLAALQQAVSP